LSTPSKRRTREEEIWSNHSDDKGVDGARQKKKKKKKKNF
jgi:hypothetical protein